MRLIAYVRVSTDDQSKYGHSLPQQPVRIAAWAALHGHVIVDVIIDDGVSASKVALAKRPGGKTLLARLAAGEADGVVAQRIDRLFRSARDGLAFAEDFAIRHRVALLTADGSIDTTTPTGWLLLAITLVTAQYEALMTAQRSRETSRSLREAGAVYGTVPYGCVEVGGTPDKRGVLMRCPRTWPIREMIVRWRSEGITLAGQHGPSDVQHLRKLSLRSIRDLLREQRITAPAGGRHWSLATLKTLIDSHADLCHLPMAVDGTPAPAGAPETEVSPE